MRHEPGCELPMGYPEVRCTCKPMNKRIGVCESISPESNSKCVLSDHQDSHSAGHEGSRDTASGVKICWATNESDWRRWLGFEEITNDNLLRYWQNRALECKKRLDNVAKVIDVLFESGWIQKETAYRFREALGLE
jgi:hypothetical protein